MRICRNPYSTFSRLIIMSGIGLGWGTLASANCGMDVCPMHSEVDKEADAFRPITGMRYTGVEPDAAYIEAFVGGAYQISNALQAGVHVPLVSTRQAEGTHTGLGNIVLFVNGSVLQAPRQVVLNLGAQLEVPTVSDPVLGDGHFLILPTAQAGWHPGKGILMGTVGWGRVLDGDHNHGEVSSTDAKGHDDHDHGAHDHGGATEPTTIESIVNPHAESELHLRVDIGRRWEMEQQNLRLTLRADAIAPLVTDEDTSPILNVGPAVGVIGDWVTSEVYGLMPITESQRYAFRAGLRLRFQLR